MAVGHNSDLQPIVETADSDVESDDDNNTSSTKILPEPEPEPRKSVAAARRRLRSTGQQRTDDVLLLLQQQHYRNLRGELQYKTRRLYYDEGGDSLDEDLLSPEKPVLAFEIRPRPAVKRD